MFQEVKKPSKKVGFFLFVGFLFTILYNIFLIYIHYRCPFHEVLHIWCAGCGGTRMIISFFQLDFYQSFRYNPLLFIFLVLGMLSIPFEFVYYTKKKVFLLPSYKALWILLGIFFIYMILRNLEPFVYLIPTEV